jgi:ABC-2 type transport system permease protein
MRNTWLVMKAAISNNLRLRSVAIVSLGVVFICVIGVAAIFVTQFIIPEVRAVAPDRTVLENFLGLIMFTTAFMSIGIYANVFGFQSMTREKSRGNIQALLATPLAPGEVWLGKSLAVFLPGLVFAELMTLAAFLALNYLFLVPDLGLVVTPWMLISNFIGVPLVYLALTLLVHLIGLTGKAGTGNVISQIFLPVMIALMINLAIRQAPNAGSWIFSGILFSVAVVFGVIVLVIRPKLTAEKIILSS